MAGGIGSRFWPFSRTSYPKQFHDVLGTGKTLIQSTVERFEQVCPKENIYIVTNKLYTGLVKEQLPFLSDEQVLLEPLARNTAPCIAYACYKIAAKNPEASILVAPSDHIILKEQAFVNNALLALNQVAKENVLITLGIQPTRPDTGYGYIQYDKANSTDFKKVVKFTEKPPLETAKQFVASGEFVWNAGIFVWSAKSIIRAFEKYLPVMHAQFEKGNAIYSSGKEASFIDSFYHECESISIDYGIMEKADNVFVVLSDLGWSDLGTWKSLYENRDKDANQNVIDGNVLTYDVNGCIVKTPKDKLVVLEGLENYIVAEFDGVLMVCRKDSEQRVKDFVTEVKKIDPKYS